MEREARDMLQTKQKKREGLSEDEVLASRARHGSNRIAALARRGFWRMFFSNLGDPVIKVLLFALVLHVILLFRDPDWLETAGIAVSVLLATLISTLSEYKGERAFSRLQESCGATRCRVRRRRVCEVDATELVVGDVVLLGAGEKIPADGIVLHGEVTVDQSALTGESREVMKRPWREGEACDPESAGALLSGCAVLSGEAEMQIMRVGDNTFLGGISGELQAQTRESPLKLRLARLAGQISRIGYVAAVVCALAYLFNVFCVDAGFDRAVMLSRVRDLPFLAESLLHAFTLALTVVVVAVPEGLPMMIAVVLSSNIRRMVRDHVLVRKPAGLEAAGSMNVLFTDKTGTLTRGKLSVQAFLACDGEYINAPAMEKHAHALFARLALAAHANSGALRGERDGVAVALGGNSTDRALLTSFLYKEPPIYDSLRRVPFDSTRKYASVRLADGCAFVTGAPERLLPRVRWAMTADGAWGAFQKMAFCERLDAHAKRGERVVLVCEADPVSGDVDNAPLCVLAAVAFSDPLRPDAKDAVRTLRGAGVQVVMVTGDSRDTAASLAMACGITGADSVIVTGEELAALSDEEVSAILPRLAVVARALPRDKSRLVRLAGAAGLVVGMTGDGINDAPALKAADVGFAMGSGTQVAKEAGDVVILDDNLASICRAVLYGRTIFKSIRKFITLQLVMNFCAVGISLIGPFIGVDAPVTVVQMLWINLIMDTLGGLAFAGEPPMAYYMKERPKRREEPILTRALSCRIAVMSAITVGLSVFFLCSPFVRAQYRESEGDIVFLTAFFALFIFASLFNCFAARTDRVRMLLGLTANRAFCVIIAAVGTVQILFVYVGGAVLRTVPLTPRELLFTLALSLCVLPVSWLHLMHRRLSGKVALY